MPEQGNPPVGQRPTQVGGYLWLGDVRRLLLRNLLAYQGSVWLVTITAPGDDQLPRDESGHVEAHAAHEWNRTAAKRWSELHRRAQQATRRELGSADVLLAYTWQLQKRGVLHLHLVLGFETERERAAARCYVAHLRRLARVHGFGYIDARDRDGRTGKATVMEPHRAAGYLSKYLGESSQLLEAIALRARPRRVVYVARRLTVVSGTTMRRLRRVRFLYWIRKGESLFAHAGNLPRWFRDPAEYAAVAGLANAHAP